MTDRRGVRLALATLAVLVTCLSGCGGKDSDSGSGGGANDVSSSESKDSAQAVDPCAVLDKSAIESVLGTTVTQDGPATDANRGRSCAWDVSDGKVYVNSFKGKEFYAKGELGPDIDGVGDEAQGQSGYLLFIKGDDVIGVQILAPSIQDKVVPLAQAIAAKL